MMILDFSHNFLMDIEENVLIGMNITVLNLAHNAFRRLPTSALRKLAQVLVLYCFIFLTIVSQRVGDKKKNNKSSAGKTKCRCRHARNRFSLKMTGEKEMAACHLELHFYILLW
jgi:hypothetical protein